MAYLKLNDMEITVTDYLSNEEIKYIVSSELRQQIREHFKNEENAIENQQQGIRNRFNAGVEQTVAYILSKLTNH